MHRLPRTIATAAALAAAAATAAAPAAAAPPAPAPGDDEEPRVRLGQLVYEGGRWEARPGALRRLAWEVRDRTSVPIALDPAALRAGDGALYDHPMLVLHGDRPLAPPAEGDLARLRRFLTVGGFLWIDSAETRRGGGFDRSVRALVGRLFPDTPLSPVGAEHVLYKSFYLLDRVPGRAAVAPLGEGIARDGRLLLLYTLNDVAGALGGDAPGAPGAIGGAPPPFGRADAAAAARERELAVRFGVNVVMYALCGTYKEDQVHVPFILERRRWKVE